jgi:hypothetical protein
MLATAALVSIQTLIVPFVAAFPVITRPIA